MRGACPARLLVSVHNPAAAEVVRAQLHDHPVAGQDPDVMHPHLAADVRQDLMPIIQLHPKERVRQGLYYRALDLDGAVLLGHILRTFPIDICLATSSSGGQPRLARGSWLPPGRSCGFGWHTSGPSPVAPGAHDGSMGRAEVYFT